MNDYNIIIMKCIGIKDGKIGGVYESFVIKEGNYYDYKKEIRYVFSWGNETGLSISEKVVVDSINNGIYISKEDMNFSDDCGRHVRAHVRVQFQPGVLRALQLLRH